MRANGQGGRGQGREDAGREDAGREGAGREGAGCRSLGAFSRNGKIELGKKLPVTKHLSNNKAQKLLIK